MNGRALRLLLLGALPATARAQNHPPPARHTAADVPIIALGYSPLLDEPCAMQRGRPLDTAVVARVRAHEADWRAQWAARGPALLRTAREVTGAPYQFVEAVAALVTCGLPSMSFPLVLNANNFLRADPDSAAAERTLLVNTLFHEATHRYVNERVQTLPGGTTPLLRKYAAEPPPVRNHLHLFAMLQTTYERLGLADELRLAEAAEAQLRGAPVFARAHAIVAAEGVQAFLAELRPAAPVPGGPPREGYVTTPDSVRLFYRVAGTGRDTLIAIHGGPGVDLESLYGDFGPLFARHVVIFYDQRGAGRSTLPADTTTLGARQQVADLEAVRAHFRLAKATLVAHSYGPLLAADYALAHPDRVRRMVFFGPVPPRRADLWQRYGRTMGAHMDSLDRARMASANRRLTSGSHDADAVRQACRDYWAVGVRLRVADTARGPAMVKSDLCASDPAGIRYGLATTNPIVFASYGDWDLRARLKTLRVPLLVVHGEADAIPMDLVREWTAMPNARVLPVANAGHFAYAERPDVVWPEVERFLRLR